MKFSNKEIKKIAEYLDSGLTCYIHKETKEIKSVIDSDDIYIDEELWKEELDEIENNKDKYLRIEKMSSREGFQIMEDFIGQVTDEKVRNKLIAALNKNKPFRNFKNEIDSNEEIRKQWFRFKEYKYEEWVRMFLENDTEEDNEKGIPKMMGFYDDDGNEYNPDLYPIPNLCMSCKKKDNPNEEIYCSLTRLDQLEETEFKCVAYEKIENK